MTQQPEALRLADALDGSFPEAYASSAADELRRLHEANEAFGKRQEWWNDRMFEMEAALRQAVEALEEIPYMSNKDDYERLEKITTTAKQALKENT